MTTPIDELAGKPLTAEEEAQWRGWLAAGIMPFGDAATQGHRIARLLATLDAARSTPVPASNVSEGLRESDAPTLRKLIRAAISDAYYEARNDGETMEHAANVAASAVWTVLEGWSANDLRAALAHAAPEGLTRYYLGTSPVTGIGQMYEDPEGPWVTYKDVLAHAAPDVMALTEAIYAVNWLTPDPKPTRASSWRWARAEVLARKIAARLSQPAATEEAER